MTKSTQDNDPLPFTTIGVAASNLVRYLSTKKQDNGRSDLRPEDQRECKQPEESKGEALRSKFSSFQAGPNAA